MKENTFYLQLHDGIVVGFNSHDIDAESLPIGVKIVAIETDAPMLYMGLEESQIYEDPLPVMVIAKEKNSEILRKELKKLYDNIQFSESIFEDTTKLKEEFEIKRKEYTAIVEQTAQ
jgi:hypothetical protein